MPKKGKVKNGNNKAKHSRLMTQKKNKLKREKERNKQRIKELIAKKNTSNL